MNENIITKNSQINRHPENSWRRLSKGHVRVDRAFLLLFMLLSMASSCQESKMSENTPGAELPWHRRNTPWKYMMVRWLAGITRSVLDRFMEF